MNDTHKIKKVPMRMCIACRQMCEKKALLRIVRNEDGVLFPDYKGKANGRGAYICKKKECLEKAVKIKAFERTFGAKLDEEVIKTLSEEFNESEN